MNDFLNSLWQLTLGKVSLRGYFDVATNPFIWLDLLIIALILWLIFRFIHRTRGERIIWGIVILLILWALAAALNLRLLTLVLQVLFASLIVIVPVVFQPELRSGLERIGRSTRLVTDWRKLKPLELEQLINEVMQAVKILAQNRFGAIIVITRLAGLQEFVDVSERINARLGHRLLISIFYPKNPLHDGAVIVSGNRILAARVTLPLSDETDLTLGTRHRAALGIAEQTDALAVAVSEETGKVSVAFDGKLIRRITYDKLQAQLRTLLSKSLLSTWRLKP